MHRLYLDLKKYHQYVFGRNFTLSIDNKALRYIFDPSKNLSYIANSRFTRWLIILNEYDYDIEFRPTKSHANANMLSRLPVTETIAYSRENLQYSYQIGVLPVTVREIKMVTENDPTTHTMAG